MAASILRGSCYLSTFLVHLSPIEYKHQGREILKFPQKGGGLIVGPRGRRVRKVLEFAPEAPHTNCSPGRFDKHLPELSHTLAGLDGTVQQVAVTVLQSSLVLSQWGFHLMSTQER
ncbi:hypothetical protein EYF80_062406 [Liparis tanakae]|uniref:K Homology domain-containing protein n=1 Tax=Liparis tanakae TaxID=230148 RepID=A0A4Z2EFH5_9TELE|nr:hypothetical protein EYF80_062406 [Liparis tanakae]